MSEFNPPKDIHAAQDLDWEADYDPCVDDAPSLTGKTFSAIFTPTQGISSTTVTKTVTHAGTKLQWSTGYSDFTVAYIGEIYHLQVRRTDSGSKRVWLDMMVTIIF